MSDIPAALRCPAPDECTRTFGVSAADPAAALTEVYRHLMVAPHYRTPDQAMALLAHTVEVPA